MSKKSISTGALVVLRLGDVMCPDFDRIVAQLGPDLAVEGEVVLLSDRGNESGHFAIVSVPGINGPLIVPVSKLEAGRLVNDANDANAATRRLSP